MVIFEAKIARYWQQCDELVKDYYKTTIASSEVPDLDFAWPTYIKMEENRYTLLMVALDGAELAGLSLYLISPHLHHKDEMLVGLCDMIGVRPSHRNKGIGRELVKRSEDALRSRGCTHMIHMYRKIYDVEPLFTKLGFKPIEISYMKELF